MPNIFISYSHEDTEKEKNFEKRLQTYGFLNMANIWSDGHLEIGGEWDVEIKDKLEQADIIVFLMSSNLLSSSYIMETEIPLAKQLFNEGVNKKIIPVMLEDCPDDIIPDVFGKNIEGAPKNLSRRLQPVTSKKWESENEAWTVVLNHIVGLIKTPEEKEQDAAKPSSQAVKTHTTMQKPESNIDVNSRLSTISIGIVLPSETIKGRIEDILKEKDDFFDKKFNDIIFCEKLTVEMMGFITQVRLDDGTNYPFHHKCMITGALTVSLLHHFDRIKALMLLDLVEDKTQMVWKKALTGLLLGLTYWDYEVDDGLEKRLTILKSDPETQNAITDLFYYLSFMKNKTEADIAEPRKQYEKIAFFDKNSNWFLPFYINNAYLAQYIKKGSLADDFYQSYRLGDDCSKYATCIQFKDLERNTRKSLIEKLDEEGAFIHSRAPDEPSKQNYRENKDMNNFISILLSFLYFSRSRDKESDKWNDMVKWNELILHFLDSKDLLKSYLTQPFLQKFEAIEADVAGSFDHAIEVYSNYLKTVEYKDASALKYIANCYYFKYDEANALTYLLLANNLDPFDSSNSALIGAMYQNKKPADYVNALSYRREAYLLDAKNLSNMQNLAYCYHKLEIPNYEAALRYHLEAKELKEKDEWNLSFLGYCYQKISTPDFAKAAEAQEAAYSLDDKDVWNIGNLGFSYQNLTEPDFDKALFYHLRVDELTPNDMWNLNNIGYCYQNLKQPDFALALKYFLRADQISPASLWNCKNIAYCFRKLNPPDFIKAAEYHERVFASTPDDEWNKFNLGWTVFVNGDIPRSKQYMEDLLAKNVYAGECLIKLGHIAMVAGDNNKAADYYSRSAVELGKETFTNTFINDAPLVYAKGVDAGIYQQMLQHATAS